MATQYAITKAGRQLTDIVRKALEKAFGTNTEKVILGIPGRNQNVSACIYLYDIRKNGDTQLMYMRSLSATELQYPSNYYDLYFMIVPYSESDLKDQMEEELKILDVLIQCMGEAFLFIPEEESAINFELCDIDFDEKTKIWNSLTQPVHTAVYCKAVAVEVPSLRKKKVSRVTDIQMNFVQEGSNER